MSTGNLRALLGGSSSSKDGSGGKGGGGSVSSGMVRVESMPDVRLGGYGEGSGGKGRHRPSRSLHTISSIGASEELGLEGMLEEAAEEEGVAAAVAGMSAAELAQRAADALVRAAFKVGWLVWMQHVRMCVYMRLATQALVDYANSK